MNVLGLIPARAGSTRVPGKNIRPFAGGDPLFVRTIRTCLASRLDRVVLSTDSEDYAARGRAAGADVPFLRPPAFASTTASAMSVVKHCLRYLRDSEGYRPDAVAYLQPTNPFRRAEHIDRAMDILEAGNALTVLTLAPAQNNPGFMWKFGPAGEFERAAPDIERPERSQDQPKIFVESAVVILTRTEYLEAAPETALIMSHENFMPLLIDEEAAIDINTELDFAYAELVAARRPETV